MFLLLCAVQAGCLGVGLWMHRQFTRVTMVRNIQAREFEWLDQTTSQIIRTTSSQDNQDSLRFAKAVRPFIRDARRSRSGVDAPAVTAVYHVDDTGELIAQAGTGDFQQIRPQLKPLLGWSESMVVNNAAKTDARHGQVRIDDQAASVVVVPSIPQVGFLIVVGVPHFAESRAAVAAEGFGAISAVSVTWTFGLMAIASYMIIAKFQKSNPREQNRSAADALRHATNLIRTRDAVIFGLAKLADSRDPDTGDHLERISVYATTLAAELMRDPRFVGQVTPSFVRLIGISAALHDIGKVGVEDGILLKKGSLTDDERARMQQHATIGGECLAKIEQRLGSSNFLQMAREIALGHHERWDGMGYPLGVSGTHIPLSARIVAVADVYDALSSRRVYKRAYDHEECKRIILEQAGSQFDPDIIDAWLRVETKFRAIAAQFDECDAASQRKQQDIDDLCHDLWEKAVRDTPLLETAKGSA